MDLAHDSSTRANEGVQEAMNGFSDMRNIQMDERAKQNSPEPSVDTELESWNPMAEDFSNLAFNAYREPTTEELRHWMPKPGKPGPSEDLLACFRSKDGDVRLFINGIPIDMTQEGVKGLFNQVGKVVYCKVIPQRDPSRIDKFGFVGYNSYREAEHAIRKFDGFSLGQNMRFRVNLAKDRPKLPEIKPAMMNEDFIYTRQHNGVDEKSEINDLDWGPPATPLNLAVGDNSTPQEGEHSTGLDQEKSLNTEASVCNGDVQNRTTVPDISKPASKKPIAPSLEPLPCTKCGKEGRRRCGNCKIPYCSKECQRSHWLEHKMLCNWKTSEEKTEPNTLTSKHTSEEKHSTDSPPNSTNAVLTDTGINKKGEMQSPLKQEPVPTNQGQDSYSFNDEDFEISEVNQFAHLMGLREVPQSPKESPSPQNLPTSNRESPISSPQESHYGFVKPLKAASPKPLITEITSSVSPVSEPITAEGLHRGSRSSTPDKNQVSMPHDASFSVIDPQNEEKAVASGNVRMVEEPEQRPYKRYYISEVPHENMSIGGSYEIVGTSVSSPTLFWAQLYEASALASQRYLFETIKAEYENMSYKTYVPSPDELCVAQFSKDNNWYRSKVDYIGNNGLIRVTHIDFGSSEDIDPTKIRRIKEDLVHVPRQALKCALNLTECPSVSREWSPETVEVFKSKVLDVKCRVEVKQVKGSVLYLDVYDNVDNTLVNALFKEAQLEKTTMPRPLPRYPQSNQTSPDNKENSIPITHVTHGPLEEPLKSPSLEKVPLSSPSSDLNPVSKAQASMSTEAEISMSTEAEISRISRVDNASPILKSYPVDVQANRVSPIANEDTSHSSLGSPSTSGAGGFESFENTAQASQSFHSETQMPPELYYQRPANPANDESFPKDNRSTTDVTISGQESPYPTPEGSFSSRSSSKCSSEADLQLKSPVPFAQQNPGFVHGLPFKAVVNSVKSPWEFTAKLSEPHFVEQLESLTRDLDIHCSTAPFEANKVYSYGEVCAAKLSEDNTWHRGKVVANFEHGSYKIRFVDLGVERILSSSNMRDIPDQFKGLEPQCLLCSLGGVRKLTGSLVWGKGVCDRFASLVLYKSFTIKQISRHNQCHIIELLDESAQPSVAKELISAGLADAYIKKIKRSPDAKETSKPILTKAISLHYKSAISSAKLPPPNSYFQFTTTEIESPGAFFVQLVDKETNQRLSELCQEMNKYYADSTTHPDWQARETQFCAALFKGSWFRAYVESVDPDNAARIYCVDFGNSEVVSTSALRPLAPTFLSLPHCALRCSLPNIVPVDGAEWSKEATEFMRLKIPISATFNARLIYKGQSILFIDVIVSSGKSTESIVKLLVAKGFAKYKIKREERYSSSTAGVSRDRNERQGIYIHESGVSQNKLETPNRVQDSCQKSLERIEDKTSQLKSGISSYSLSVYGCAIAAAKLPNDMETFEAVVTEVTASGEFFIHVADEGLAVQLLELTNSMNEYYNAANQTKFEAKQNLLCAAKFSSDWRRAYILGVNPDETAKVYDVDFGKTETLPFSQLKFLQSQFRSLQYFALRCKLSLPRGTSWSKDAYDLFLSKIKLLDPVTLKLFAKRREIMFVDVFIPESGQSLCKVLISQGQERNSQHQEGGSQQNLSNSPRIAEASNEIKVPSSQSLKIAQDPKSFNFDKALASITLPPEGQTFYAVITEFQNPQCFYIHSDVEMAVKLSTLFSDMNSHYNAVPRSPFKPMENQLCVAPFESPSEWYRALVEKISTDDIAKVFFVDFGNTNNVPLADLRPIEERFSPLPYCALHTSMAHVEPIDSSGWTRNAIDFMKSKVPVGTGLSFKLISKHRDTLFVDVVDPQSAEGSLSGDLVKAGFACFSSVNGEKSPAITSRGSSPNKLFSPSESAIASANLPPFKETFQVIATHVTSPGCFSVQIADYEMACKVAALGKEMNTYYHIAQYPPFQPVINELCAAQFTGNSEWYRGWIDGIVSDGNVHVYYPDYGNAEVISVSRLRPLETQFTALPFSALTCSVAHVVPHEQGEWKQEAIDLLMSKVPLYEPIDAKLVYKKKHCLFLDIIDARDDSSTISKSLVEQGLAVWMQETKRVTDDLQTRPQHDQSKRVQLSTHEITSTHELRHSVVSPYATGEQAKDPIPENPDLQTRPQHDQSKRVQLSTHEITSMHELRQSVVSPYATGEQAKDPIPENPVKSNASYSSVPLKKHFLESIPLVSIPKGEFFNAMVCEIKETGTISLQMLTKELEELDSLCMAIGNHCRNDHRSSYCPVVGELCLACFSQDNNWYRAVVDDILPNDQYKVTFVDFGNDDTLSPSAIREVEATFLQLPRQAYTGLLAGLPASKTKSLFDDETLKALHNRLLDKRVFARVEKSTNEIEFFSVGPDDNPGASINKEVLQKSTESITHGKPSVLASVENEFMAFVSEVIGTEEIWVQRKDALSSLEILKEDLSSYCESSSCSALTSLPCPGDVCLSQFSMDSKWYRAKVIESNSPDNILVQFVDYGNAEAVSLSNLRVAKVEFLEFPFQGIKCYLVGVAQGNPDANEYVQQTIHRELKVKIRERHSEELGVELEDYGVPNGPFNINENLIAFGYIA